MVIQISLLGLAFICFAIIKKPNKKDILLLLGGGFVISWLALLTMAYAPGNMNRDTIMAELSIALLRFSLESAFKDVPRFLYEWFSGNISLVVLLLSAGMSAGLLTTSSPSKAKHHLALGALLFLNVYILMWAGFVPQFAVMGIRPVEHAIFMPMFLFLWVFVLLGLFQGEELRAVLTKPILLKAAQVCVLVTLAYTLVLLPVRITLAYARFASPLSLYALRWDARDSYLRQASAAGQTRVVAESLRRNPDLHAIQSSFWIEGDLQDVPDHWINQAASTYYGLDSITLRFPAKSNPYGFLR